MKEIEIENWKIENNHLEESKIGKEDSKKSDHFKDCNLIIKNQPNFFGKSVYFLTTNIP